MKIAISVPDDIFNEAESLAQRLNTSRSELYSRALKEFVGHHAPDRVTERMNQVVAEIGADKPDVFRGRLGIRVGPAIAVQLIGESLLPRLQLIDLTAEDTIETLRACDAAGVRGVRFLISCTSVPRANRMPQPCIRSTRAISSLWCATAIRGSKIPIRAPDCRARIPAHARPRIFRSRHLAG